MIGSKKAQESVLMESLVYIIIVVMVLIIILGYAKRISSEQPFDRQKLAIDRSVLLNKLVGIEYNVDILLPNGQYNSTEEYTQNMVKVYGHNPDDATVAYFFPAANTKMQDIKITPEDKLAGLHMVKEGNRIVIQKAADRFHGQMIACDNLPIKISQLVVDPSHGGVSGEFYSGNPADVGDSNPINSKLNEAEFTFSLAQLMSGVALTRTRQEYMSMQDRKGVLAKNTGAFLIGISAGNDPDASKNVVTAYILWESEKYEESRYVACIMLNQLTNDFPEITGVSIVPVNPLYIKGDDPLQILNVNNGGVVLEIGNMQIPYEQNMLRDPAALAMSINQAIRVVNG